MEEYYFAFCQELSDERATGSQYKKPQRGENVFIKYSDTEAFSVVGTYSSCYEHIICVDHMCWR